MTPAELRAAADLQERVEREGAVAPVLGSVRVLEHGLLYWSAAVPIEELAETLRAWLDRMRQAGVWPTCTVTPLAAGLYQVRTYRDVVDAARLLAPVERTPGEDLT